MSSSAAGPDARPAGDTAPHADAVPRHDTGAARTALAAVLLLAPAAAVAAVLLGATADPFMAAALHGSAALALIGAVLLLLDGIRAQRPTPIRSGDLVLGGLGAVLALSFEGLFVLALADSGEGMGAIALVVFMGYAAAALALLALLTLLFAVARRVGRRAGA